MIVEEEIKSGTSRFYSLKKYSVIIFNLACLLFFLLFHNHSSKLLLVSFFTAINILGYFFVTFFFFVGFSSRDPKVNSFQILLFKKIETFVYKLNQVLVIGMWFRVIFFAFEAIIWLIQGDKNLLLVSTLLLVVLANIVAVSLHEIGSVVQFGEKEEEDGDIERENESKQAIQGTFYKHFWYFLSMFPIVGSMIIVKKKSD